MPINIQSGIGWTAVPSEGLAFGSVVSPHERLVAVAPTAEASAVLVAMCGHSPDRIVGL